MSNQEGIPETKEFKKLILEIFLNGKFTEKPSINFEFKREIVSVIHKYYPNWNKISYEFQEE